jgi:hypothetical protein
MPNPEILDPGILDPGVARLENRKPEVEEEGVRGEVETRGKAGKPFRGAACCACACACNTHTTPRSSSS